MADILVHRATSAEHFAQARALVTEFLGYMLALYADLPHLTGEYYEPGKWARHLGGMEAECSPPHGACLLATEHGVPVGCVSLVRLGPDTGEIKRMFVAECCRGRGVGEALCRAAILEAGRLGYARLCLDTGRRMHAAQALYRRAGFTECTPYYPMSQELAGILVFMERDLSNGPPGDERD